MEAMKSTIHVFGHDDTFDSDSIRQYIESDIFDDGYDRRYRYNQLRNDAKIIVLSHAGEAYGHFEITGWEDPTNDDIEAWPKTKRVYIVSKSHSYESPSICKTWASLIFSTANQSMPTCFKKFRNVPVRSPRINRLWPDGPCSLAVAAPEKI